MRVIPRAGARAGADRSIFPSETPLIYRQFAWTRITHWIWAISLFFLLLTGLQIFNAHPALYIGDQSGFGSTTTCWRSAPRTPKPGRAATPNCSARNSTPAACSACPARQSSRAMWRFRAGRRSPRTTTSPPAASSISSSPGCWSARCSPGWWPASSTAISASWCRRSPTSGGCRAISPTMRGCDSTTPATTTRCRSSPTRSCCSSSSR